MSIKELKELSTKEVILLLATSKKAILIDIAKDLKEFNETKLYKIKALNKTILINKIVEELNIKEESREEEEVNKLKEDNSKLIEVNRELRATIKNLKNRKLESNINKENYNFTTKEAKKELKRIRGLKPLELAKEYNSISIDKLKALLVSLKSNIDISNIDNKDNLLDLLLKNKDMEYRYTIDDVDKEVDKYIQESKKRKEAWKGLFGDSSKDYKGLYKKLAKYLHPDKPTGNEELFKAISILK